MHLNDLQQHPKEDNLFLTIPYTLLFSLPIGKIMFADKRALDIINAVSKGITRRGYKPLKKTLIRTLTFIFGLYFVLEFFLPEEIGGGEWTARRRYAGCVRTVLLPGAFPHHLV